ncbi:MAG: hypothetical protein QM492_01790 [Rhodobacterales bacterium]
MKKVFSLIKSHMADQGGAVTVEFVVLSATVVLLAGVVMSSMSSKISAAIAGIVLS